MLTQIFKCGNLDNFKHCCLHNILNLETLIKTVNKLYNK